jgi:hypothetical protein
MSAQARPKKATAKKTGPKPKLPRAKAPKAPSDELAVVVAPSTTSLTKAERALVAEALRRAESARNVIEGTLLDFGRWLLVDVFHDDAAAALGDRKRENKVWLDLLSRAGGPTLRLTDRFLYVALEIAAHDKRIQDDSWRLLEPGRKELLLPLRDESLMRKAARRVVEMKLSHRSTRELVRAELSARGDKQAVRVTPQRFHNQVKKFRERVVDAAYKRKVEASLRELPKAKKLEVRRELEALHQWASDLLAAVR